MEVEGVALVQDAAHANPLTPVLFAGADGIVTTGTALDGGAATGGDVLLDVGTAGVGDQDLAVNRPVLAGLGTVRLVVDGNVSQRADGQLVSAALGVISGRDAGSDGTVTLNRAANDVGVLAVRTAGGEVRLADVDDLRVGAIGGLEAFAAVAGVVTTDLPGGTAADGDVLLSTGTTLTLTEQVAAGAATVRFSAGGDVTQLNNGTVTANALGVRTTAGGDVLLSDLVGNDVNVFAAVTDGGEVRFEDVNDLIVSTVTALDQFAADAVGIRTLDAAGGAGDVLLCVGGGLAFVDAVAAGQGGLNPADGTVRLTAGGAVTQSAVGTVTGFALGVRAGGSILLSTGTNDVAVLAAEAGGDFTFADRGGLSVSAVGAIAGEDCFADVFGLTALNVTLCTDGVLGLSTGVTAGSGGGTVRLSADAGVIQSPAGSAAVVADALGVRTAGGEVVLGRGDNAVNTFAAASAGGRVLLENSRSLTVGTVAAFDCFAGAVGINTVGDGADGRVTLRLPQAGSSLTIANTIDAGTDVVRAALTGAVIDGTPGESRALGGGDLNVVAGQLTLAAGTGIGNFDGFGDAVQESRGLDVALGANGTAGVLAAVTGSGDLFITDSGPAPLSVGTVAGGDGVGTLSGLTIGSGTGDLVLRTTGGAGTGDLTVAANVVQNGTGSLTLAAGVTPGTGAGGDDADLTVAATVAAGGGATRLVAADDLTLTGVASVATNGGTAELHAGGRFGFVGETLSRAELTGDLTMADGSAVRTAGGDALLTAARDVNLSLVDAPGAAVFVSAADAGNGVGRITDTTAAESPNVNAVAASLRAGGGIGDANELDLSVATLAGVTDAGDLNLAVTGPVVVGTVDGRPFSLAAPADAQSAAFAGSRSAAGLSGLTVTDAINAAGSADAGADRIALRAAGGITVADAVQNRDRGAIDLDATAGGITLDAAVAAGDGAQDGTVTLRATDTVSQSLPGTVTAGTLAVNVSAGEVDLRNPANAVAVFTAATAGGGVDFVEADGFRVGVIGGIADAAFAPAELFAPQAGVVSNGGPVVLTVLGTGSLLGVDATIASAGGNVLLRADDADLAAGGVDAGAASGVNGDVQIAPRTNGGTIDLGTNAAGSLGLTAAEVALVRNARVLAIGARDSVVTALGAAGSTVNLGEADAGRVTVSAGVTVGDGEPGGTVPNLLVLTDADVFGTLDSVGRADALVAGNVTLDTAAGVRGLSGLGGDSLLIDAGTLAGRSTAAGDLRLVDFDGVAVTRSPAPSLTFLQGGTARGQITGLTTADGTIDVETINGTAADADRLRVETAISAGGAGDVLLNAGSTASADADLSLSAGVTAAENQVQLRAARDVVQTESTGGAVDLVTAERVLVEAGRDVGSGTVGRVDAAALNVTATDGSVTLAGRAGRDLFVATGDSVAVTPIANLIDAPGLPNGGGSARFPAAAAVDGLAAGTAGAGAVTLDAGGAVATVAPITAAGSSALNGAGDVFVTAAQTIVTGAAVRAGSDAVLTARAGSATFNAALGAGQDASVLAATDLVTDAAGTVTAGRDAALTAGTGGLTLGGTATAGRDATLTANLTLDQNAAVTVGRTASLAAGGNVELGADVTAPGAGGTIMVAAGVGQPTLLGTTTGSVTRPVPDPETGDLVDQTRTAAAVVRPAAGNIEQPGTDLLRAENVALSATGSIGGGPFRPINGTDAPANPLAVNLAATTVAADAGGDLFVTQGASGPATLTVGDGTVRRVSGPGTADGVPAETVAMSGLTARTGGVSVHTTGGVGVLIDAPIEALNTPAPGEVGSTDPELAFGGFERLVPGVEAFSTVGRGLVDASGEIGFAGDGRVTTRAGMAQAVAQLRGTLDPVTGTPPGEFNVNQQGLIVLAGGGRVRGRRDLRGGQRPRGAGRHGRRAGDRLRRPRQSRSAPCSPPSRRPAGCPRTSCGR